MTKTVSVIALAVLVIFSAGCGSSNGPDAPKGLTVTNFSPITLSWDNVSGATSYNVYRGTISGTLSTKTRLASNITVTTYTDSSATVGTTYFYQVTAENSDGVSDGSNEVSAASQSQPGNTFVLGGSKSSTGIVLNWSNFPGAVSYNVYRGNISAIITNKKKIASGILPTTFTDIDVTTGGTFFYQVTAVNSSNIEIQVTNEISVTF